MCNATGVVDVLNARHASFNVLKNMENTYASQ